MVFSIYSSGFRPSSGILDNGAGAQHPAPPPPLFFPPHHHPMTSQFTTATTLFPALKGKSKEKYWSNFRKSVNLCKLFWKLNLSFCRKIRFSNLFIIRLNDDDTKLVRNIQNKYSNSYVYVKDSFMFISNLSLLVSRAYFYIHIKFELISRVLFYIHITLEFARQ